MIQGNGVGYINAGLPNITGYVQGTSADATHVDNGAFRQENTWSTIAGGVYAVQSTKSFDASRSSSIYGASTTVQPAACKTYMIIKY